LPQLAIWIAFAGLLFTVVSALAAFAYKMGGLNQQVRANTARIRELEQGEADGEGGLGKLREGFAEFRGTVTAKLDAQAAHIDSLQRSIDGQSRQLANIATGQMGQSMVLTKGS
jgi:hypothetical protein